MIGSRDFQLCVVNKQTNAILALEDYKLENIKTVNSRLEAIHHLVKAHPFASKKDWESIKIAFKTLKYTLVPGPHFAASAATDYLVVNSEIKTKLEEVYYYKHISNKAVNVFAMDKRIVTWAKKMYPNQRVQIIHQGSAFLEGLLSYDDHNRQKSMFCFFDRGTIHVCVTQSGKLLYYNLFMVRSVEEYLKYIMMVFKELGLSSKINPVVIWGMVRNDGPQVALIHKYIRNVSLGSKPHFLKFQKEFDKLPDHRYFDLYSMFLCE